MHSKGRMLLRRSSLICGALLVVLLVAAPAALAADYYVNNDTGDDATGTGSSSAPWKTIARGDVLGVLSPGDTVHVAAGTYPQATHLGVHLTTCSGAPGAPITYKAEGAVLIDMTGVNSGPDGYMSAGMWVETGLHDIVIDGFEITNAQWGVYVNGDNPTNAAKYVTVRNCKIHEMKPGNPLLTGWNAWCGGVYLSASTGSQVYKNFIYNIGDPNSTVEAACIMAPVVQDCKFFNNTLYAAESGLRLWAAVGPGNEFRNNIVVMMLDFGMYKNGPILDENIAHSHNLFGLETNPYYHTTKPGTAEFRTDPLFEAPWEYNFALQAESPAINAGINVGLPYNGPAPDIGAFESNSTTPATIAQGKVTVAGSTKPIEGAIVTCLETLASAVTDADGNYRLPLAPGTYTLEASIAGLPSSQTSGIAFSTGETKQIDFELSISTDNFYVDFERGSDDNDGLAPYDEANPPGHGPWKTIQHANSLDLIPGDTVHVAPGTYVITEPGGIALNHAHGNSAAPITYKADGQVILDASALDIQTPGNSFGFIVSQSFIVLDGFEIKGTQWGVYLDGDGADYFVHDVVVRNCVIHDVRPARPADGGWSGWCGGVYSSGSHNCIAHNNLFYNIGMPGTTGLWHASIAVPVSQNFTAYNNTCDGGWAGVWVWAGGSNLTLKNNIFMNPRAFGIGYDGGVAGAVHSNNLFYNCPSLYSGSVGGAGAAEMVANPQLNADYTLMSSSPAINAGVDVGLPFVSTAPDIGAFESAYTTATGIIYGKVTENTTGHPALAGAKVGALDDSLYVLTDADGNYSAVVPAGTYVIQASLPGRITEQATVTVTAGGSTLRNFDLTPKTGGEYYVNGTTGNDAWDGTSPTYQGGTKGPWKSINRGDGGDAGVGAGVGLAPGDIIYVAAGTYTGNAPYSSSPNRGIVLGGCSGNAEKPITYKAQGEVIIDQLGTWTPGSGQGYAFGFCLMGNANYTVIDGFTVKNSMWGVFLDGPSWASPPSGYYMHDIVVRNCKFLDMRTGNTNWAGGVMCNGSRNVTIEHNLMYRCQYLIDGGVGGGVVTFYADNIKVLNNTIDGADVGSQGVITLFDASNMTIKNNIFSHLREGTVSFWSGINGVTYANNMFFFVPAGMPDVGWGPGGFAGDPRYVDPAALDFTLRANSPAIDAGVDVGLSFEGNAPDIGAFETNVTRQAVSKISDLKKLDDGAIFALTEPQAVVSIPGTFTEESFNIEEPSRLSGIRVFGVGPTALGQRVTLSGEIWTMPGGERAVGMTRVISITDGLPVRPLGLNTKSGNDSLIGMLMTIWGRVTYKDPAGDYIYIDDGSGYNDENAGGHPGFKVMLSGLTIPLTKTIPDSPLPFVTVTGLVGMSVDGTTPIPVIRPRGDTDIMIY